MRTLLAGAYGSVMVPVAVGFFTLGFVPGAPIWMWGWCGSSGLKWLDWVLAAFIPGYGFFQGLECM